MPGFYYILNYSNSGIYEGTSIGGGPISTGTSGSTPTTTGGVSAPTDTGGQKNPIPIETSPVTTAPVTPAPVTPTLMSWLTARAKARAGQTICRVNWVDHYIYFSQYLWWVQFYDPTSKALGILHVIQSGDFGIAEFQAQDWTVFGQQAASGSAIWNYPLATTV